MSEDKQDTEESAWEREDIGQYAVCYLSGPSGWRQDAEQIAERLELWAGQIRLAMRRNDQPARLVAARVTEPLSAVTGFTDFLLELAFDMNGDSERHNDEVITRGMAFGEAELKKEQERGA